MPTVVQDVSGDSALQTAIAALKAKIEGAEESSDIAQAVSQINTALGNKQDKLTFDNTPTAGSTKPVTSGGVKTALDGKQNTLTFDSTPAASSTNPVTSGGVKEALDDMYSEISDRIAAAEEDIDIRGGAIYESASGSLVEIADGADDLPMKSAVVSIDPIQDLHGYDYPWPAGGGKNLLDTSKIVFRDSESDTTINGITLTKNSDGSFKLSGTATAQTRLTFKPDITLVNGSYTLSITGGTESALRFISSGNNGLEYTSAYLNGTFTKTYTVTDNAVYEYMYLDVQNGATVNSTIYVQLEKGSTATAWSPYENICPISGWTGLSVERCGKNLLPMQIVSGSYLYTTVITVNDDKSFVINKTSTNGWVTFILGRFALKPGTYTLIESDDDSPNAQLVLDKVIGDTTETLVTTRYTKRYVFTIEADTLVQARYTRSSIADNVLTKLMLFIGNTATAADYEPYKGSTYSVNWETEAGTVYGGTLDIVSGKLTVDRAIETITKDSNWYSFSTGSGNSSAVVQLANIPLYVIGSSNKNGSICSSGLELQNYWTSARQGESGITDNGYAYTQTGVLRFHRLDVSTITTLAEFKSAFPDTQVCYKLATPTEIQLTPQEVRTLLGVNNIWSDAGDMAVEYPADTKSYIDNKIAEAIAAALA